MKAGGGVRIDMCKGLITQLTPNEVKAFGRRRRSGRKGGDKLKNMRRSREEASGKSAKPLAFHKYNKEGFPLGWYRGPDSVSLVIVKKRFGNNGQAAVRARVYVNRPGKKIHPSVITSV